MKYKIRRTHNLFQVLGSFGTVFQTSNRHEAEEWIRNNKDNRLVTADISVHCIGKAVKYAETFRM